MSVSCVPTVSLSLCLGGGLIRSGVCMCSVASTAPIGVLETRIENLEWKTNSFTIDFGSVPGGTTHIASLRLRNTGGAALTVTKSKPPLGTELFATNPQTDLHEGVHILPGESETGTVAFQPVPRTIWNQPPKKYRGVWTVNTDGEGFGGPYEVEVVGTVVTPQVGPRLEGGEAVYRYLGCFKDVCTLYVPSTAHSQHHWVYGIKYIHKLTYLPVSATERCKTNRAQPVRLPGDKHKRPLSNHLPHLRLRLLRNRIRTRMLVRKLPSVPDPPRGRSQLRPAMPRRHQPNLRRCRGICEFLVRCDPLRSRDYGVGWRGWEWRPKDYDVRGAVYVSGMLDRGEQWCEGVEGQGDGWRGYGCGVL